MAKKKTAAVPSPFPSSQQRDLEKIVRTLADRVADERPDRLVSTIHLLEDQLEASREPSPELVAIAPAEGFDHAWANACNRLALLLVLAEAKRDETDADDLEFWGGVADLVQALRDDVEAMRVGEMDSSDRLFNIEHPEDARALDRIAQLSTRRALKGGSK